VIGQAEGIHPRLADKAGGRTGAGPHAVDAASIVVLKLVAVALANELVRMAYADNRNSPSKRRRLIAYGTAIDSVQKSRVDKR